MQAAEIVRHLQQHILRDVAAPTLWSVEELLRYLSEAESIFARRTHCIVVDSDEPAAVLTTAQGVSTYALDPSVIHVYEIMDDTGRPLHDRSRRQLARTFGESAPRQFTTGRGSKTVRLAPTPDKEYALHMLIARKPERPLTCETDEPEIPEEYHLTLCQYAAYMCLSNNAPEGSDTISADKFLINWETAIREAKREQFRLRVPANARVVNNWTGAGRI